MKKSKTPKRGIRFVITSEMIREYLKLSPEMRLAWLQEGIVLSYQALTPKRRAIWEKFRRGQI